MGSAVGGHLVEAIRRATLYPRTGQQMDSQPHFTTATAMYRDIGMTY